MGARPCCAAAAITAAHRAPPPMLALARSGSTVTVSSRRVEISSPPSIGIVRPVSGRLHADAQALFPGEPDRLHHVRG